MLSFEEKQKRKELRKIEQYNSEHKTINGIDYKYCKTHNEFFPEENPWLPSNLDYFYKNKTNSIDGLTPRCKRCEIKKYYNWIENNPEKYKINYTNVNKNPCENTREYHRNKQREKVANGKFREYLRNNKDKVKQYSQNHRNHDITKKEMNSCFNYFNWKCAYCGLSIEVQYKLYEQNFHKDHVDHEGYNDVCNCVPACTICSGSKWKHPMEEWYRKQEFFSEEKLNKIYLWCNEDYKNFIEDKLPYKYKRKRILDKNTNTYYLRYELWIYDENRNLAECIATANSKKDIKDNINQILNNYMNNKMK